ncbi:hypothetical protein KIW84_065671 [Lathyrus oleraceus]|uniref:Uncharacterized protein n=1 Tax=Pisum sativum TaxID=3888 RepID=A0A9D4WHI0_PEA|nr:hypothetical protein KIW84_065671 [Pisum sativum]
MSSSRIVPNYEDAEAFMAAVKFVLQDKSEEYTEFLKILIDYKAKRVDIEAIKKFAIELFQEHTDLISRLNIFMPPGHHISLPLDDEQRGDNDVAKEEQKDDEGDGDALAVNANEQQGDGKDVEQQGDDKDVEQQGDDKDVEQQGDGKDVEQQGDGKDVEQQGVPHNSKMLTLRFIPMPIRNRPNFTIRNIHSGTKVSDMKKFLELHVSNAVPQDGKFFFIHKHRVMYENQSFEMHDARTGDRIELFDGVIIQGDD